jgi:FKBP-type peptidyl-prolyl cis-trans isomerase FkpA
MIVPTRPAAFALLLGVAILTGACSSLGIGPEKPNPEEDRKSQTDKTRLEITEVAAGTGAEARPGRRVAVQYTGWLFHPDKPQHHGRMFDSSRTQGQPFEFTIGASEAIPGWDEGVSGMKVGGKRTLVIPPSMAYGRTGYGDTIPPNATLVFDVELASVK